MLNPSSEKLEDATVAITKKFSNKRVEAVKRFVSGSLDVETEKTVYDKIAVTVYASNQGELREKLKDADIELLTFRDLISKIIATVDEWKRKRID